METPGNRGHCCCADDLTDVGSAVAFVEHAGTVPRTRGFPSHWMLFHMAQPMNQPLEIAIPCESARSRRCCRVASASQPSLTPSKLWNDPCDCLVAVTVA